MKISDQQRTDIAWRRDQILSAVGFAANAFLRSANWKEALDDALERLGKAAQANRAYFFENRTLDDGAVVTSQVAEWAAPGIEPQIENPDLLDVPYQDAGMGRWLEMMSNHQPVHGLISDFPECERGLLEAQGIQSLVVMPVFAQNKFAGFLGFDDCESLREWAPSEFDALFAATTALGAAIDRQHLEDQLRFSQKMEAIGSFASGVAHEFNNMLQAIVGLTSVVKLKMDQGESATDELDSILTASEQAHSLTRQLLVFSRKQDFKRQLVDLGEVCQSVGAMMSPILGSSIDWQYDIAKPAPVIIGDAGLFSQVLVNLCLNARDAMPEGGTIELSCHEVDLSSDGIDSDMQPGRYACLSVTDSGCGMSLAVRKRIFEPFFTTKEGSKGTGLGLSVAYGVVRQSGGTIVVSSEPDEGAKLEILIPVAEQSEPEPGSVLPLPGGVETVLLVDDQPMVLSSIQRLLETMGYTVLAAESGIKALELYREHAEEIAVVITDSVMPEMDGAELIASIKKINPGAKAILASGFIVDLDGELNGSEDTLVIQKPMGSDTLQQAIRSLLD